MTQLHDACKSGDLRKVTSLLSNKGWDINALNTDGESPLHIACKYGHLEIVKVLLKDKKCDLNTQNIYGNTPLHLACNKKLLHVIRVLLERRCSTNISNKQGLLAQCIHLNEYGDCLLHIACRWGDVDIVRYLITDQKCNVNIKNTYWSTPLHIACSLKSLKIIRLLLEKRCHTNIPNKKRKTAQNIPLNEDGDCLLHIACRWCDVDIVRYLITDQKCNVNIKNTYWSTPLHIACLLKSLKIIRLLLEKGCHTIIPNMKGETAQDIPLNEDGDCLLHIVCQWGDVNIVRYLITDERCDLNVQSSVSENTPLHIAAIYGQDDIIVELLSHKKCNQNAQNKEGDTPLHIAVRLNRTSIISNLLANKQHNPNVQNKDGDTPLHLACKMRSLDVVKLFLEMNCSTNIPNKKRRTAQSIPLNEAGDFLLHIACQWGDMDIVKFLIIDQKYDFNIQNKYLNTPLHIACCVKSLSVIRFLLKRRCSTNIPNKKGVTAQDIPLNEDGDYLLHIACQWGDVDMVRCLITDQRCNPNVKSSTSENSPLHIAVKSEQDDTIVQLLSHKQCNPNVQNKEGDTPLHIACCRRSLHIIKLLLGERCSTNISNMKGETAQDIPLNENGDYLLHIACQWGDVEIVRYLITDEKCNPNVQNTDLDTPLHIACCQEPLTIVRILLERKCSTNIPNKKGETAQSIPLNEAGDCLLHIACQWGDVDIVKYLITEGCNPNVLNNDPLTPLLTAIKHNNHTVATALLQHKDCDPTLCDPHGNTPLHLACIGGETCPEMVKIAKQLLVFVDVDPLCVNNAGQTPIELTTNYQLIQAITHFVKCKTKQSVQTYINMFIVGNPETGKSTLVKAICKEASILWKIVPKNFRRVKNVPLHTAGIIPTTFRSKTFGNTVIYDLAGQVEYYTSHAAVIRSTVISTPPAFIVVVNLSDSEEKISQTLRYWWSFIDNHAAQSSAPPQVILVGSHADVVKSTGRSVQEKMTRISALCKKLPASFQFAGEVALDCRDPASKELRLFCSLVNQSCTVLREKADVDLHCHVLYAFLLDRFKGKVACMVSDVATSVKENRELLPQNSTHLIPLISTLSDKGLLFLVKGDESHGDWWIILQKQALLAEINGAIFAPKSFTQHKDLSWNTGVVPSFKLKNEFPDYNPNMVTEFLTHLEFCFIIEDPKTLSLLKDETTNVEDTSPDVSEKYYFFPALVSVEYPLHVWEENDNMCRKCGWIYKCIRPDQFLTAQFLHVLILRLAFTFALKLDPGDCREDSLPLCRKCSVWKHGIAWFNRTPIETVVEVGLQYQSVFVMMRCPKGKEAECVQLRSEVIQKVLEVNDEYCKAVKMSESFIHPANVKYPFTDNVEDRKIYSLPEIARVIAKGAANALDHGGRNPIQVQDLLLFDSYSTDTSSELLRELFSENHSMDETVRSQVLETLNSEYEIYTCVHYAYHVAYETISSTV